MTIDQEVAIRSVFVLADTTLSDGRVFQYRNSVGEITAHFGEAFVAHNAIALIRIEWLTVPVDRDLNAAAFHIRQAICFVFEINPRRQRGWFKTRACRRA